jgi:hypothetical protein
MVSPVHGDYRRYQAEIPLIALSKFPRPALLERGKKPALHYGHAFRDDECRVTDHASANFTTLNHMAYNLDPQGPRQSFLCPSGAKSLPGMVSSS